jgi:hypothetical protein
MLAHSMEYHLDEYPRRELLEICQHYDLPSDVADYIVGIFESEQRQKTATFRSFLGALPRLKALTEDPTFREEERPAVGASSALVFASQPPDPNDLFLKCLRANFEGSFIPLKHLLSLSPEISNPIFKETVISKLETLREHPQLPSTLTALQNPLSLLYVIAYDLKTGFFEPDPTRGRLKRILALKDELSGKALP